MKNAGIYLHIPFCLSRCSYCDFATGMYNEASAERYVLNLITEIESWREVEPPENVDTIYFGGGTPSLLTPPQLEALLKAVRERFTVSANSEITIEINPGSVTSDKLTAFREIGINRASFGAQTFDDHELARLGRSHSSNDTRQTFRHLRDAGFDNISLDLIAGLPGQTMAGWKRILMKPSRCGLNTFLSICWKSIRVHRSPITSRVDFSPSLMRTLPRRCMKQCWTGPSPKAMSTTKYQISACLGGQRDTIRNTGSQRHTTASAVPHIPTTAGSGAGRMSAIWFAIAK